jgi:EAL domain-containing protein (putative c-di-GMP-specific phosphodiesterase class I)
VARHLDLTAVAEGVETAEQLRFLESSGCPFFQGFYFSRPLTEEAFTALLWAPA